MGWNADHTSVGRNWGTAPTVCQGIQARINLATEAHAATVHALDGNGARTGTVPSTLHDGRLAFEIGPSFRTLWYEITAE